MWVCVRSMMEQEEGATTRGGRAVRPPVVYGTEPAAAYVYSTLCDTHRLSVRKGYALILAWGERGGSSATARSTPSFFEIRPCYTYCNS